MKKAICWLGYGQGGEPVDDLLTLSTGGIDRLALRIEALGVHVEVQHWTDSQEIYNEASRVPANTKIIIGGTSLSANLAPFHAKNLARPVAFLFGIQPSLAGARVKVPSNVREALCFSTPWWAVTSPWWFLGAYRWERESTNKTTALEVRNTYAPHPGSNDEQVQLAILNRINEIASLP